MKQQFEVTVTDKATGGVIERHTRDSKYAAKVLKTKLELKHNGKTNYQFSSKPLNL